MMAQASTLVPLLVLAQAWTLALSLDIISYFS
ncbi:hypothetical protein MHA_2563 [Mannheimia haemolytica PHL213]|nr:hypothetical protein MHA_2563 [Mannheimia haemolytica PHL213]